MTSEKLNSRKSRVARVTGVTLGALVLVGTGLSTASASAANHAARTTGAPARGITRLTNVTSDSMTLCSTGVVYDVAPAKTVAPGDTTSWTAIGGKDQPVTSYCFPNGDKVSLTDELGDGEHETAASKVMVSGGNVDFQVGVNYATFINQRPQTGDPHHYDVAQDGATIHIDAAKDPAAAAEALTHMDMSDLWGGPRFTFADGEKPTFHYATGQQAGAKVINESSAPAKLVRGHATSVGESTDVDGEISASLSAKVFGLAVKAAVSTDQGQEWASSDTTKTTEDADIDPDHEGWLTKNLNVASLSGQIAFTSAPTGFARVDYDFTNFTISRGGILDPSKPVPPINYSVTEHPITNTSDNTAFDTAASDTAGAGQPKVHDDNAIVIDAATDPADAKVALTGYKAATNQQFNITSGPTYSQTPYSLVKLDDGSYAPSVTGNPNSDDPACQKDKTKDCGQPVNEILAVDHENSASWSLGGSVEGSVGYDLADIVDAEVSDKLATTNTWESKTTDSQELWVTAEPGKTVWIEASNQVVTFTGDFAFTDPYGRNYEVDNVTITQPASADGDRFTSTTYKVEQVDSTIDAGVPAGSNGGRKPISQLPALQRYIATHQ